VRRLARSQQPYTKFNKTPGRTIKRYLEMVCTKFGNVVALESGNLLMGGRNYYGTK